MKAREERDKSHFGGMTKRNKRWKSEPLTDFLQNSYFMAEFPVWIL